MSDPKALASSGRRRRTTTPIGSGGSVLRWSTARMGFVARSVEPTDSSCNFGQARLSLGAGHSLEQQCLLPEGKPRVHSVKLLQRGGEEALIRLAFELEACYRMSLETPFNRALAARQPDREL